jgi:hypothetical protein
MKEEEDHRGIHKPKWLASQQQTKSFKSEGGGWGGRGEGREGDPREGGRSTTSKEEKNIERERERERESEREGIRVDFSLPCSISPSPTSPSSKVMNEKELWVLHFYFFGFFFCGQIPSLDHKRKTREKTTKMGEKDTLGMRL